MAKLLLLKEPFLLIFLLDLECILWLEQGCSEVAHVSGADESEMLQLCFGFLVIFFFLIIEHVLFVLLSLAVTKGSFSWCGLTNMNSNKWFERICFLTLFRLLF